MAKQRRAEVLSFFNDRWSKAKEENREVAVAALTEAYDRFHAEGLADNHFDESLLSEKEAQREARMGELLFAMLLWQSGFELSSASAGPDFRATKGDTRLCFEVITPEPIGLPKDYLQKLEAGVSVARSVPHRERALRWTHALKTKSDKWTGIGDEPGWLEKGTVDAHEPYIVVINSFLLDQWGWEIDGVSGYPYPTEICFGLGPFSIAINPKTGQKAGEGHQYQPAIDRGEREPVSSAVFLATGYDNVSAVLGCYLTDERIPFGVTPVTELVHNGRANVAVPRGLVPAQREWFCQNDELGIAISNEKGSLG